jgi:hypothetical protein
VEGFTTRVSGSTDLFTAAGAAVVVVADRAGGSEWAGDDALMLLRRLRGSVTRSVIVCAGSTHRNLVERGVCELQMDRQRFFGTAPEALTAGARALTALALDASPRDVSLSVLGVPPSHIVIPWDAVTFAGFDITDLLDEPARRQLGARITALWPPGPYTLASAAVKTIEAMVGRTRAVISCFLGPDDSMGQRTRTAALPVRVCSTGVERVLVPTLNQVDRIALENAMLL